MVQQWWYFLARKTKFWMSVTVFHFHVIWKDAINRFNVGDSGQLVKRRHSKRFYIIFTFQRIFLVITLCFMSRYFSLCVQWSVSVCAVASSCSSHCGSSSLWLREVFVRLFFTVWTSTDCWSHDNSDSSKLLHLQPGLHWWSEWSQCLIHCL